MRDCEADPSTGGAGTIGAPGAEHQRRLSEIEDRKIEILLEIADINREYDERVSALREEYAELDAEYYEMRLERMLGGGRVSHHE
jgi:hypothetical protein